MIINPVLRLIKLYIFTCIIEHYFLLCTVKIKLIVNMNKGDKSIFFFFGKLHSFILKPLITYFPCIYP